MGLDTGLAFWQVQLLTSLTLFVSNALPNVAGMGPTAGRELHSVSVTEVTNLNGSIPSYKPENGQNCLW